MSSHYPVTDGGDEQEKAELAAESETGEFIIPGVIKMIFGNYVVIRNSHNEVLALTVVNDNNYAVFFGHFHENLGRLDVMPGPDNWDELDAHVEVVNLPLKRRWDELSEDEAKAVYHFLSEEFLKI